MPVKHTETRTMTTQQACTADAINAAARDLYTQHQAANDTSYRLALRCAYGDGKPSDRYAAATAREAIFNKLLALRGVTFLEWVGLSDAERKTLWGL